MTDQASPDYNAALSDARTATRNAQALADRLRGELDEAQARWEVLTEQYTQEVLRRSQAVQERRALCDLLSADSGTIAGQTLVEALKAIIAERDGLRKERTRWLAERATMLSLLGALHTQIEAEEEAAQMTSESGQMIRAWWNTQLEETQEGVVRALLSLTALTPGAPGEGET